jgi:hypothetical protein
MAPAEYRAQQLSGLAALDIALPAAVTAAISGYEAVMALPHPGMPERGADTRAIAGLADELARDALTGKQPAAVPWPLDVSAISAARQADQDALDRVTLSRELRASAAAVLTQIFSGANGKQVIAAIQAKHNSVMSELIRHASSLPEGTDDQVALEQGGAVRESWLAARDLTALITTLREAVFLVEDRQPDFGADGLELCTGFERSGRLYLTAWQAPTSTTVFGPLGSLPFWLTAAREPDYEWWLPAAAELSARITSLREQMYASRLAGVDPQHVF